MVNLPGIRLLAAVINLERLEASNTLPSRVIQTAVTIQG